MRCGSRAVPRVPKQGSFRDTEVGVMKRQAASSPRVPKQALFRDTEDGRCETSELGGCRASQKGACFGTRRWASKGTTILKTLPTFKLSSVSTCPVATRRCDRTVSAAPRTLPRAQAPLSPLAEIGYRPILDRPCPLQLSCRHVHRVSELTGLNQHAASPHPVNPGACQVTPAAVRGVRGPSPLPAASSPSSCRSCWTTVQCPQCLRTR
jgi:hypothetical protein